MGKVEKEIKLYPEDRKILRKNCERIPEDEIENHKNIIQDMKKMVEEKNALGLAAPQIGVPKRITVINSRKNDPFCLINPKITHHQGEIESEEGCLSFPGLNIKVKRSAAVQYYALDDEGNEINDDAHGFLSTIIQHEIDHLNGILFIDYLGEVKKKMKMKKYRKIRKKMERNQSSD